MFALRLGIGLAAGYLGLVTLAWLFQNRIAFPSPRAPLPDPARIGVPGAERLALTLPDGTALLGLYLPPLGARAVSAPVPALLWFYGNGENVGSIWPIVRDFRPPGVALFIVDYPGYGASGGRATEAAVYAAADVLYETAAARPEVDRRRILVYGRSLGSAVATYTATRHPVAGLILESPFVNAAAMARQHYGIFPRLILRLRLDNLERIARVRCPILVFHGTADRLVPLAMGRQVAAAAGGPVELVLIDGAGHNDTYDLGGRAYRDKLAAFVAGLK